MNTAQLTPVAAEPGPAPRVMVRAPRGSRALDRLFTGAFALFGAGLGLGSLSDNSFFWHLVTGRIILDSGVPHTDPFSFSASDTSWVAQSWLAEALYGGIDRVMGPFGIRLVVGLVGAGVAVALFRLARRLSGDRVRAALVSIAALAPIAFVWSERPLTFGLACFVALVWAVEVESSTLGRHAPLVLVGLLWLWANVHGSFALGVVYLGVHLVGRWCDGAPPWRGRERGLAVGGALGVLVVLANPYGPALLTFPLGLLGRSDVLDRVTEWQSPDFSGARGVTFAVWAAVVVGVTLVGRFSPRRGLSATRGRRRDLLVAFTFLAFGFWALRNIGIAAVVTLPIAARALARRDVGDTGDTGDATGCERRDGLVAPGAVRVAGVALVLLAVVLVGAAASRPDFSYRSYPVAALRALDERGLTGSRLFVDDGDAGYVLLEYWPRQRVFFDDRFDMYPRAVIDDYFTVADGDPGWDGVLDRHGIETVVWPRGEDLTRLLGESDEWRRVHRDVSYAAFVRSTS